MTLQGVDGNDRSARRALVTGADGMLGVDLCETLAARGFEVVASTVDDMDITDAGQVRERLERAAPTVVVHAAAYTNVDGAEDNRDLCFAINAEGAGAVAAACREIGAKTVFISTDYVFDGRADTPYDEASPVSGTGVYGETKLAGEERVREANPDHTIVRVSWLQGVHCWRFNANFIEKIIQAAGKYPTLKVVGDQRGAPTFTFDVAARVADLIDADATGVVHLTNDGDCTWYDFACALLEEAGVDGVSVEPTTTAEWGAKAPRPAYSVLDNARLRELGLAPMPHWRESLSEYFRRRPEALARRDEAGDAR
jgi:dTDP-4-dehydrorhamnose reductase